MIAANSILEKIKAKEILKQKLQEAIRSNNPMVYACYGKIWIDNEVFQKALEEYEKCLK